MTGTRQSRLDKHRFVVIKTRACFGQNVFDKVLIVGVWDCDLSLGMICSILLWMVSESRGLFLARPGVG